MHNAAERQYEGGWKVHEVIPVAAKMWGGLDEDIASMKVYASNTF